MGVVSLALQAVHGGRSAKPALALLALGLVGSVLATWVLRSQDSGASLGWVFICGPNAVPAPDFPGVLTTVAVEPVPLYLLTSAAFGYAWLFRRARREGHARLFPVRRLVSFLGGIAFVALTVLGPLAAYDHTFLSIHMVQHFLLITIAPPLLLGGAPLTLLLVAVGRKTRQDWFYPVLHSAPFHGFTHPLVGLVLFGLIPTSWYVTPLFEASLESDLLHYSGYGIFLFAGLHYWWPIINLNPTRWHMPYPVQLLYLLALVPIHAFLGLLFYEPRQVLYPSLAEIPRTWGPSALGDQQFAGAFMFVAGEALGLIALLLVAARWAKYEDEAGRRFDRDFARRKAAASASTRGNS